MATTRQTRQTADLAVFNYLHRGRLLLALLLGFATLVVMAALAAPVDLSEPGDEPAFTGAEVTPPRALPALALARVDDTAWSSAETRGRLSLFFFGYTSCPDVCPLTLGRARQLHAQLGADAAQVDVYFITVDPERDTRARLGRYVSQFSPDFIALTGTAAELEAARAAFGVIAVRQPHATGTGYAVDHTASSYLVDGEGRIRLIYPHDAPSEDVLAGLRALLASE